MEVVLQWLALSCTSLFAGAALYISLVEHPARLQCDTAVALAQWKPSYALATIMQASLAVIGALAGLGAWLAGSGLGWLFAALSLGAVVPFTFIVIMPTNHRLKLPERDPAAAETRMLLEAWGRLHAVRTALSLLAMAICVTAGVH